MPKLDRRICVIAVWAIAIGATQADDLRTMPVDQPALIWVPTHSERVRNELKLSDEQREKLEQLAERPAREWKPEELKKQLAGILTAEQLNRLQQIAWQVRPDDAMRSPEISEALGITKDQRKQIDRIWQDGQASLINDLRRARFGSENDRNKFIHKRLTAMAEAMRAILTDEQCERFVKLLGKRIKLLEESTNQD